MIIGRDGSGRSRDDYGLATIRQSSSTSTCRTAKDRREDLRLPGGPSRCLLDGEIEEVVVRQAVLLQDLGDGAVRAHLRYSLRIGRAQGAIFLAQARTDIAVPIGEDELVRH